MSLFVCDECKAIENTALGFYWSLIIEPKREWFKDKNKNHKRLCAQCVPDIFSDGSPNHKGGKWHGHFPKETATTERIDEIGRSNFVYTAGL